MEMAVLALHLSYDTLLASGPPLIEGDYEQVMLVVSAIWIAITCTRLGDISRESRGWRVISTDKPHGVQAHLCHSAGRPSFSHDCDLG